jgi:lipoprotein-releasing system permease protein
LFSKKSLNAIHIISGISMLGILVGSAALVIILSVFNGFENLILSMYTQLTPEIRVTPKTAKFFVPREELFAAIQQDPKVLNYTEVLEEKALLRYGKNQYIATVKGLSDGFTKGRALDSTLLEGTFVLNEAEEPRAVIGAAVQAYLGVNLGDQFQPIEVFSPRKEVKNSLNPTDEFTVQAIFPSGVFQVQQDFDNLVLVPIAFARTLLGETERVSAIELNLKPGENVEAFQENLQQKLGDDFVVKNRVQQNQLLYKILNSEKWAIFLILTFVLLIAIFNIIGSLTMLVIDKKKDIAILSSMGAGKPLIQRIFFIEGMLISLIGCLAGMGLGLLFCILQQQTGFIQMGEGINPLLNAYPVDLKVQDFLLVFATVAGISAIASAISSRLSIKGLANLKEDL